MKKDDLIGKLNRLYRYYKLENERLRETIKGIDFQLQEAQEALKKPSKLISWHTKFVDEQKKNKKLIVAVNNFFTEPSQETANELKTIIGALEQISKSIDEYAEYSIKRRENKKREKINKNIKRYYEKLFKEKDNVSG